MKKLWLFASYISTLFILMPLSAHAELTLNTLVTPKAAHAALEPLFEKIVRPYGNSHSAAFPNHAPKGTFTYYEGSNFNWTFNSLNYLSNIASFVPDATPLEDCKPDPLNPLDHHCDWIRERNWVCHLFMFNSDLSLVTVTPLNINRRKEQLIGKPFCQNVKAMSVAKVIPDAMLITLGYSDSNEPADPRYAPPEFITTFLLRFSDQNGKLQIEQDDSCLGNPNNYKTIAAARNALKQCASK
ncbi:hypothetical protein [Sulfuriferula sp. AH1]|uniref:hypothetical protein n=1 Tax=Sulfuriferula sp. AH1 TaxID=1985873 RepID=UPI0012F9232C|nr:hypothetical protein [Sulfuriferula sp. AH1]